MAAPLPVHHEVNHMRLEDVIAEPVELAPRTLAQRRSRLVGTMLGDAEVGVLLALAASHPQVDSILRIEEVAHGDNNLNDNFF